MMISWTPSGRSAVCNHTVVIFDSPKKVSLTAYRALKSSDSKRQSPKDFFERSEQCQIQKSSITRIMVAFDLIKHVRSPLSGLIEEDGRTFADNLTSQNSMPEISALRRAGGSTDKKASRPHKTRSKNRPVD